MKRLTSHPYFYIALIAVGYCLWAAYYIFKTSYIAANHMRFYSLFDDAMISMRYAWNLAHGRGLVWNRGERVEGITNLLMTLFMSLPTLFLKKRFAVLAIQISGVLFVLANAFFAMKVGTRIMAVEPREAPSKAALFFFGGLSYFPFSFWTLFGMETGMVSVLLWAAVWSLAEAEGRPVVSKRLGLFLGLAFLTRPDTAVASLIIMLFRWYGLFRVRGWLKTLLSEAGIIALFAAGVTLFRWLYYGELVPNTYALKITGIPLLIRMEQGALYLVPFVILFLPITLVALAGARAFAHRLSLLLIALFVGFLFYHLTIGPDPFVYWRQLASYVPMVLTAFIAAVLHLFSAESPPRRPIAKRSTPRIAAIARRMPAVLLIGAFLAVNWEGLPVLCFAENIPSRLDNRYATNLALSMSRILKPEATIALFHAGVIGYYADFKAIDCLGKSDKVIARRPPDLAAQHTRLGERRLAPGHNKYDLAYSIEKLKPTYIERAKWGRQNIRAYAMKHYQSVRYKRTRLLIRKDSRAVRWGVIAAR